MFREVLDSIYVVHKCVGCFYTIATNFGFLVYTTFLYKSLVPVTLTGARAQQSKYESTENRPKAGITIHPLFFDATPNSVR